MSHIAGHLEFHIFYFSFCNFGVGCIPTESPLNYVATDYVPKISKALIGPARIFNVVLGVVTFVGLSKIALNDRGGIKGMIMGLWRPDASSEENKKEE